MPLPDQATAHRLNRRELFHRLAHAATWSAAGVLAIGALSPDVHATTQDNWRMCRKCHMMFFAGYQRSVCPAGGRHDAAVGANFLLPYDVAENANAQGAWRFCNKCQALFFDGYPGKGVCPRGGGHAAQGFVFVLPHDVRAGAYVEKDWRFCNKCYAIFSNLSGRVGRCAPAAGTSRKDSISRCGSAGISRATRWASRSIADRAGEDHSGRGVS